VEAPDRAELAQIKAALERADQERAELRILLGAAQQLARALPAPAEAAPTQDEPARSSMPPPEPPMPTRPWWRRWFAG
jgi:hypothetical protein